MSAATATQLARTTSRVKIPQRHTRSTFDRNFIAAATSSKPITTLTALSHPPDFGSCETSCGTSANTKNGSAKTIENASMPTTGYIHLPCAAITSSVPPNGPVQVNDASENISPIKSSAM